MVDDISKDAEEGMKKAIEAFKRELAKVRTGRATTAMLDGIKVDYYGTPTPVNQVATVTVVDARLISVKPWEKNMVAVIDKAIRASDLGINPVADSDLVRLPIPPLTQERRKDLVKGVKKMTEEAKVAVRAARRDAMDLLKDAEKDKEITEDERKNGEKRVQDLTDRYVGSVDELATTSARVQEKLLRVIEYGEFERVGGAKALKVDVRLVCATNEDLPQLAARGQFRHDLLDRLAFDVITLPPLRERREDILMLAEHFAHGMTRELGYPLFAGFSRKATQLLQDYPWPGNVRELKNVVERSLYRQGNPQLPLSELVINPFDSPWRPRTGTPSPVASEAASASGPQAISLPLDLKGAVAEYEINLLKQAMQQSQYNQRKAAQLLTLSYHQFRGMLRKYQLLDGDDNNGNADND